MADRRNTGFDCLRATACLGIILLHTVFSTSLMYAGEMTFGRTLAAEMVTNNLMWAVPCFIMVTGALLLPPEKQVGYGPLFRRYIARVVKAIALFGALFVVLEMLFNPNQRTWEHLWTGLYEIFTGESWSHMWYLYCLVGLYLLLPVYKKVTAQADQRDMLYIMGIYTLFLSVIPGLKMANIRCGFYIHVSSVYPLYLFMGYWLSRWGAELPRRFYGGLFLAATALITGITYIRVKWDIPALEDCFQYASLPVIAQTLGLAGWFFRCREEGFSGLKKALAHIDRHSFGIYLIHMAYIRLLFKHLHFDPFVLGLGGVPGVLVVVLTAFGAAYITDMAMKKLPLFRSVV